jgi:hypothetical protein
MSGSVLLLEETYVPVSRGITERTRRNAAAQRYRIEKIKMDLDGAVTCIIRHQKLIDDIFAA